MRGITRAELDELRILDPPHIMVDFEDGDPCEEILANLIEQGRAVCRKKLEIEDKNEEPIPINVYYITEQGRAALNLWRKVGDAVIT